MDLLGDFSVSPGHNKIRDWIFGVVSQNPEISLNGYPENFKSKINIFCNIFIYYHHIDDNRKDKK